MKSVLFAYLMIVCVYCDTNIEEFEGIEKIDLEADLTKSDKKIAVTSKDLKDEIILKKYNEQTQVPAINLNDDHEPLKRNNKQPEVSPEIDSDQSKSPTEKPTQSKSKQTAVKTVNNLKEQPELIEVKSNIINATDDIVPKVERTSKNKRVHHRKHLNHNHKHGYNNVCRYDNVHHQHRKCYKLKKQAYRQKKLAKILYPNGVPYKTQFPIDFPKETNISFSRVIKSRKAHDKKIKLWLKLRRMKLYERRRKQHKRVKTSKDVKNTTAKY